LYYHSGRKIGLRFLFFVFTIMSFSELDELAKGLVEPSELPSDSVEARLSAQEAAIEEIREQQTLLVTQQARLLEHVTGLARHLVRSPEAPFQLLT
jgi:hypothetical protein